MFACDRGRESDTVVKRKCSNVIVSELVGLLWKLSEPDELFISTLDPLTFFCFEYRKGACTGLGAGVRVQKKKLRLIGRKLQYML